MADKKQDEPTSKKSKSKTRRGLLKEAGAAAGLGALGAKVLSREEEEVNYRHSLEEAEIYEKLLSDTPEYQTKTETIIIEEADEQPFSEYRNEDGIVDTGGLQRAINDFIQDEIDTGELQGVINEFITGQ